MQQYPPPQRTGTGQYSPAPAPKPKPFYLGWVLIIATTLMAIAFFWVLTIRLTGGDIRFNPFESKPQQIVKAFQAAGLPASNPRNLTKADLETQGISTALITGDIEYVKFDVTAGDAAGSIMAFSRDDDYQRYKQIAGLAASFGTGANNQGKTLVFSSRDSDKTIFAVNAVLSEATAAKYREVFQKA